MYEKLLSFTHNKRHELKLKLETIFHLFDNVGCREMGILTHCWWEENGTISTTIWQHPSKNAQTSDPEIQLPSTPPYRYTCTRGQ